MTSTTRLMAMVLGLALLAISTPSAAIPKWDSSLADCSPSAGVDGTYTKCTIAPSEGSVGVTVRAVAASGSTGTIATAYLGTYPGGLGVTSSPESVPVSSPDHTMDNVGKSEFMLLEFTAPVYLGEVKIGWVSGDSDITVLAFTGCPSGVTCNWNPAGDTYNSLVGKTANTGWTLVGHYSGTASYPSTDTINAYANNAPTANSISSSYWLIGAFSNSFGDKPSDAAHSNSALSSGNDYVKLLTVSGVRAVPEPSSLLLLGLALIGLTAVRLPQIPWRRGPRSRH